MDKKPQKLASKSTEGDYVLTISSPEYKKVALHLTKGKEDLGIVDFSFDKNLDTLLIDHIDKLLKRNKIDAMCLNAVKIDSSLDKNTSLYKVVKAWQIAFEKYKKYSK